MGGERSGRRVRLIGPVRRVLSAQVPRAGALAGAIRVGGRLVAFGLQILLARVIVDQVEFGIYAWGQNLLFLLGALFALGIPMAASRLIAVHADRRNRQAEQSVVGRACLLLAAISVGLTAVGLAVLWLLPDDQLTGIPRGIAYTAVAAAPLVSFTMLYQAIARARLRLVAAFAPTQILRPAFTGLLAVMLVLATHDQLTGQQALAAVVGSLLAVLLIQLLVNGVRTSIDASKGEDDASRGPDIAEDREPDQDEYAPDRLMANAVPIFATRVSDLVIKHSGVLVLGLAAGPALVGEFFVAERLAQLAALPALVVGAVIQPWLASAHAAGDHAQLQRVVTQAVHTTLWPSLTAAVVIQAAAGVLLGLFGSGFVEAAPLLSVLMLAHVAAALLGPNSQILVMSGYAALAMRIWATAALLHVLLLAVLVPQFAAMGAAGALLATTVIANAASLWAVRTRLGLRSSLLLGPLRPGSVT